MGKLRARLIVSFRAKVLVPVIAVMVGLLGLTAWVVNERITRQFEAEARRTLATAEAVFRYSKENHAKNLLLRFHNLPNEPLYKALFQKAINQEGGQETLRDSLRELRGEQDVDVVMFTSQDGNSLTAKRDPLISVHLFEKACTLALGDALQGEEQSDTIRVGDKLYDVFSIPVFGMGNALIGALTFGSEIGDAAAKELRLQTQSQIALLANGRVIASTLATPGSGAQFAQLFQNFIKPAGPGGQSPAVTKVEVGGEHYFCSGGRFESLAGDGTLGYLLLSSYEQPLRALETTQRVLLVVSLLAILAGSAVVWFLVSRATEPLRELRDNVEAVGMGDFSRRVEVRSADECGDLALAFNHMTENLKQSRAQLELTVETLKTTQAQLIQSEKLSGIGEFVAGVAHELNNPLTSVMGFSELLKQSDKDPQHRRYLEMVHKSAQRCQKIVQALLSFARRHQPERKPTCLNGLVEAALEILNYQLRTSNIAVTTQFDPRLPQAMVDPHQVQQVFLNIINNGRQAIEAHQPKGWIKITTEARAERVRVTIQDSGPGIAGENLSKIFDPFFTTKEVGSGTGLGLSLCYGIIKEHGGTITARSKPGEGASFVIELPITHETAEPQGDPGSHETEFFNPREGAGKKVLVIDDEEPILQMVRETLTPRGYDVDIAPDGETGLNRMSQTRYDVTLCDWKMPGLNGREVYERVRAKNPAQSERIIFITGDVVSEKTRRFFEDQRRICLPKPFTLSEFRAAIRRLTTAA